MEGRKAEVEIFSVGDSVELLQDGKSLGEKRINDYKAIYYNTYQPGEGVCHNLKN